MRLYIGRETETKKIYERGSQKCYHEEIVYVVLNSMAGCQWLSSQNQVIAKYKFFQNFKNHL